MPTLVEYIVCPICGKTSPVKTGSYKIGDPMELGWIQIRECRGKKGFCTIETKTLRDNIKAYQKFADELVDFCSGVLMVVLEENLPVHKPVFLLKYEDISRQLNEGMSKVTTDLEDITFKVEDLEKENSKLKSDLQSVNADFDTYRLIGADLFRKNEDLTERLNSTASREERYVFKADDNSGEIASLKRELKNKKMIIQEYEDNSLL